MIAHVGGVPVEEALLPLASWAGVALVLVRGRLSRLSETGGPPRARAARRGEGEGGG